MTPPDAPFDLAKMLAGAVQVCQYCYCPVDGSNEKPGCACICHEFPPAGARKPKRPALRCPNGHGGLKLLEDTKERRVYWCGKCERTGLDGKPTTGMAYKAPPRRR